MAKKIVLTIVFVISFTLLFATISFAKTNNTTTTLGNEVTSSMNKTERSMSDLANETDLDNAGRAVENGARAVGNTMMNGMDDMKKGVEDLVGDDTDRKDNTRTDNRAVVGTTGNYTAGQIGPTDTDVTGRNGMSQNTWIWIVMIVVALVIIAAVWYYAAQKD